MRLPILTVLSLVAFITFSIGANSPAKSVVTTITTRMPETKEADSQDDSFNLMMLMAECNETFRTETSFIESLNETGSFPDETDRTPKCFLRCILERLEVASLDGVYDASKAAQVATGMGNTTPAADIEEIAGKCADRKEECKCEKAYQFMKCIIETQIKTAQKS